VGGEATYDRGTRGSCGSLVDYEGTVWVKCGWEDIVEILATGLCLQLKAD
jgi:hypothetical protein